MGHPKIFDHGRVWITCFLRFLVPLRFLVGPWVLFVGPASTKKCKFNFKIGSHGTIHIFKNYFATMFTVFSNKQHPNRPHVSL